MIRKFFAALLLISLSFGISHAGTITPSELENAVTGLYYVQPFSLTSELSGQNNWIISGDLPSGLNLELPASIQGYPDEPGVFSFDVIVNVSDSVTGGLLETVSKSYAVTVKEPEITTPVIKYSLNDGVISKDYSDFVTASNGTQPYHWSYSGTLPEGLTFASSDVLASGDRLTLSGTPSESGDFTVEISLYDAKHVEPVRSSFTFTISSDSVSDSEDTLALSHDFCEGIVGVPYSDFIAANGNALRFSWTYEDEKLPSGLKRSLTGKSGQYFTLAGDPAQSGDYTFNISVKDKNGDSIDKTFTLKINDALKISDTFTNGKIGTAYSSSVKVTGGTGVYTWHDVKGELPGGLAVSYDSDTAAITGTPTESGDFTGTLVVSVTQPYYADGYNLT